MKLSKIIFGSFIGCLISSLVGMAIFIFTIVGMVGSISLSESVSLKPRSMLTIDLTELFTDAPSDDPFANINFMTMDISGSLTTLSALRAIETAAEDENIEGVYIRVSPMASISTANIEELRDALQKFKKSGKPIIAYNDIYSQGGYYLSSVADKVYLQPEGSLMWQGLSSSTPFFKGLLDKLDITVEAVRPTVCRYKSAVEPFILDKMSKENRAQMEQLISSMWGVISSDVALSRGLSVEEVNRIADNLLCSDVDKALELRMIDGLVYQDQLPELFQKAGCDVDDTVNYISLGDYASLQSYKFEYGADQVAIIYAEGNIVDGSEGSGVVAGDVVAGLVRKVRLDDKIKAVVLRINSGGGSALASDVMWRELSLLREQKPLVVSMGGMAASGGYYIAAPADVILVDRLTLTGSIGVFGVLPNVEKALKTKLGITFDEVSSNKNSDFLVSLGGLNKYQYEVMLKQVDRVYDTFTSIVAEGRNLPIEDVLEIAQGRVWSGQEAVDIGLADAVGGLHDAISTAVIRAGIEDNYQIVEISDEPTGLAALLGSTSAKIATSRTKSQLEGLFEEYVEVRNALEPLTTQGGLIMYSPYRVSL